MKGTLYCAVCLTKVLDIDAPVSAATGMCGEHFKEALESFAPEKKTLPVKNYSIYSPVMVAKCDCYHWWMGMHHPTCALYSEVDRKKEVQAEALIDLALGK